MSKMGSHDPFGHLNHKLWPKERSRVKLVVWLPTIKSWESTRCTCVQVACNISLKSFRGGLKLYFRPHLNLRSACEVMGPQSWDFCDFGCRNPTLRECEDETHTPEMGTWESFETPETLEFDFRGQNTLHWGIIYIIGKLSKCRCWKWVRMSHLDICSISYGKKKRRESNW